MYSKLGALPHAPLPITDVSHLSHDGYSLQWAKVGADSRNLAEEIEQLQHRSSSGNVSARFDWRATVLTLPGWADSLLLLRFHGTLQAAVYLREKLAIGIRTGYFQGASTRGDTLLLCDAGRESFYLGLITDLLLNHDRGFLLLLHRPAEEAEDVAITQGLKQRSTGSHLHWELPLKSTLETTIEDFSHRTRRNIRSSLRRVDASGWHFHPELDTETMKLAVRDLAGRSTHPFSLQHAEERLDVALKTSGYFSMGLTDQNGQWLCCLVGRRTEKATEIFWQLNAAGSRKVSLCIAMRALMTREELRRQVPRVRYIGGTCALSLPSEARYTAIARPGFRLGILRLLLRFGLPLGPVLREVL